MKGIKPKESSFLEECFYRLGIKPVDAIGSNVLPLGAILRLRDIYIYIHLYIISISISIISNDIRSIIGRSSSSSSGSSSSSSSSSSSRSSSISYEFLALPRGLPPTSGL